MNDREQIGAETETSGTDDVDENAEVTGDAGDIDELSVPEGIDD